jgi:hypothetical protein
VAHLSCCNCNCCAFGPCPWCGQSGTTGRVELADRWDAPTVACYTAPDPPKQMVPADVLLPGLAMTKAARIARQYMRNKRG